MGSLKYVVGALTVPRRFRRVRSVERQAWATEERRHVI